jgi:hypothetical protein
MENDDLHVLMLKGWHRDAALARDLKAENARLLEQVFPSP